jgi:hypothetical protein
METLLPFAVELANAPPVKVYQHVQEVFAKIYQYPAAATVYKDNYDKYGKDAATYSVGAVCDLTAMSMLIVAAGVKRVEAMKAAAQKAFEDNKYGLLFDEEGQHGRDHVHRYVKEDQEAFEDLMEVWSKLEGSGAVQLKFGKDMHTFAIERVPAEADANIKDPRFRVYQSYQNVYRLLDFLVGEEESKAQAAHLKIVYAENKKANPNLKITLQDFVTDGQKRIENTASLLGKGQLLTWVNLSRYVIEPLTAMLAGKIRNQEYVSLSASPETKDVDTDIMGVLMCDQVSSASFEQNYDELLQVPKDLTEYPLF